MEEEAAVEYVPQLNLVLPENREHMEALVSEYTSRLSNQLAFIYGDLPPSEPNPNATLRVNLTDLYQDLYLIKVETELLGDSDLISQYYYRLSEATILTYTEMYDCLTALFGVGKYTATDPDGFECPIFARYLKNLGNQYYLLEILRVAIKHNTLKTDEPYGFERRMEDNNLSEF